MEDGSGGCGVRENLEGVGRRYGYNQDTLLCMYANLEKINKIISNLGIQKRYSVILVKAEYEEVKD